MKGAEPTKEDWMIYWVQAHVIALPGRLIWTKEIMFEQAIWIRITYDSFFVPFKIATYY